MTRKLILSAFMVAMMCSCSSKEETTVVEDTAIPVRVTTVEKQTVNKQLTYSANLQSKEQVFYAPTLAGSRIKKIYVEVGDRVQKGQVLVEMDNNTLEQTELQLKNLEVEYNRAVKLNETGSISKQNYDALVTQYEVAKTAYENLKENTKMVAPFNGVITGKYMEEGELWMGGAMGGASKPAIIAIEQISQIKAYVDIAEQYYTEVKKGMTVVMTNDVYGDREFEGKVNIVYPTIDVKSRTFRCELLFNNPDEALRPGMYGSVDFKIGQTEAIVIPSLAVLKVQGSNDRYLFVVRDNKAVRIGVKINRRFEDKVEVVALNSTFGEGDKLVTTGQARLLDGLDVKVVE